MAKRCKCTRAQLKIISLLSTADKVDDKEREKVARGSFMKKTKKPK